MNRQLLVQTDGYSGLLPNGNPIRKAEHVLLRLVHVSTVNLTYFSLDYKKTKVHKNYLYKKLWQTIPEFFGLGKIQCGVSTNQPMANSPWPAGIFLSGTKRFPVLFWRISINFLVNRNWPMSLAGALRVPTPKMPCTALISVRVHFPDSKSNFIFSFVKFLAGLEFHGCSNWTVWLSCLLSDCCCDSVCCCSCSCECRGFADELVLVVSYHRANLSSEISRFFKQTPNSNVL